MADRENPILKVLYINWVDYLNHANQGGGTSVYQKNLIEAIQQSPRPVIEPTFLSAGTSYDLIQTSPRWEAMRHSPQNPIKNNIVKRFDLVNSGVLAPAHASFGNKAQLSHLQTKKIFFDFLQKTGPYDVVHFNNIEGLPSDVLELRSHFPQTKVVYTLHNYYPFCPQVNLWYNEEHTCRDHKEWKHCVNCLPFRWNPNIIRFGYALAYLAKRIGIKPPFTKSAVKAARITTRILQKASSPLRLWRGHSPPKENIPISAPAQFKARQEKMRQTLNNGPDVILCVSQRVMDIAISYGITSTKLVKCYIGSPKLTKHTPPRPILQGDNTITLAYLGYMRRDKGFHFLIETLSNAPEELLAKIHLVIAAPSGEADIMLKMKALRTHLASLTHYDGYKACELDSILKKTTLGIIPVLWEDCLPQVAIEMQLRGISLICSDLGGAAELGNCPAFTFRAGSSSSLIQKFEDILSKKITTYDYWVSARPVGNMQDHINELVDIYHKPF